MLTVAFATDHGGYPLRDVVIETLRELGCEVVDYGVHSAEPADYPPLAKQVARAVAEGRAARGVLLCGSGVGMCVVANKWPGVRACVCHDCYTARQAVEHDDVNVLCLGARVIGPGLARLLVREFIHARFDGQPHHARRLQQIAALEMELTSRKIGKTDGAHEPRTKDRAP